MKNLLLFLLLLPLFAAGQVNTIMAQYPIDEPSMANLNDGIRGRWKFVEDTDKRNFYEIIRGGPYAADRYHIKFWNRGGANPTYESNLHFSKIGGTTFINMPYFEKDFSHRGYFFLKILDTDAGFSRITAAIVHDTSLWQLSQAAVKQRITAHVSDPAYYADTVHFYKLK